MLRAALFSLVATVALGIQVPFTSTSHRWQDVHQVGAILGDEDLTSTEWSLDKLPNPNDTDHLVFETVHSLLQHWPNTRMRNGHNIVPGVIPKGTLLYHGTDDSELPPGPEWVATDPEHANILCMHRFRVNQRFQETCWLFTLATTRPLKVIYFDGNSAAKIPDGTTDTQDLVAWGKFGTGDRSEDSQRVQDLCKWGENFDVDGFVRMEMDFEIILCDFTSGLTVVSSANLMSRGSYRKLMIRGAFITFEVIDAGSWHNRFPGETRVQLDLAGLVSLYDTQLVPSLVAIRADQERWDHRVRNISSDDISAVRSRLETALIRPSDLSSGFDWKTLVHVIVDRFAGRLELTRHLLNSSATDPNEILDLANKIQTQLRIILTPYLLFSATPTDPSDMGWIVPIYKLCAMTHTYSMESELDSMTDSERSLLRAVRGTSREICRVVTKMWTTGVYAGIDPSLNTKEFPDIAEVTHVWNTWAEDLNQLMTWLDWNVWVKCNPQCGPEELCYLPTYPIGFPRRPPSPSDPDSPHPERLSSLDVRTMVMENLAEEVWNTIKPEPGEWRRPQPKCIGRFAPHEF